MGKIAKTLVLLGLVLFSTHALRAQASAQAAGATSSSPADKGSSPHLLLRTGPPPDEVNRKDFEDNAGDKAGGLLLRSAPSGAEIFINGRLVGRTPLLMVIAPGKYTVDMRGPRQESGHRAIGVMPGETQTIVINLTQQYPTNITIR